MEVEPLDLIKSEEDIGLSEIDILQYWTKNVANLDVDFIIENSTLTVRKILDFLYFFYLLNFRLAVITTKLWCILHVVVIQNAHHQAVNGWRDWYFIATNASRTKVNVMIARKLLPFASCIQQSAKNQIVLYIFAIMLKTL